MSKPDSALHRVPPYRRPIVIIGFLVVLAVIIIITILVCKNLNLSSDDSHLPGNSSSSQGSDQSKPNSPDDTPTKPEDKAPAYEGEDPNDLDELTGTITYAEVDPGTQTLHAAVTINQYLHSDGQCVFNLKRADGSILRTASAAATPDITTSVCGPFALSVSDLPPGVYQLEVVLTGDGKRGTIISSITL